MDQLEQKKGKGGIGFDAVIARNARFFPAIMLGDACAVIDAGCRCW